MPGLTRTLLALGDREAACGLGRCGTQNEAGGQQHARGTGNELESHDDVLLRGLPGLGANNQLKRLACACMFRCGRGRNIATSVGWTTDVIDRRDLPSPKLASLPVWTLRGLCSRRCPRVVRHKACSVSAATGPSPQLGLLQT